MATDGNASGFQWEFDSVGHRLFWSGLREWERETSPVILDNIRRSRCFIDIGANCGIYTVLGCTVNPDVRVVAVERVPRVFAAMANNVSQNRLDSRVTVLNVALGDTEGVVPFHEAEDATMGSFAVSGYRGQKGSVIQVKCRTLDSIVGELNIQPDFIKMDVEGFEHLVLSGAGQTAWQVSSSHRPGSQSRRSGRGHDGDFSVARIRVPQHHCAGACEISPAIVPVEPYHNWLCVSQSGS